MVETSTRSATRSNRRTSYVTAAEIDRLSRARDKRGRSVQRATAQQGSGVIYLPRVVLPPGRVNDKQSKSAAQSRSRSLAAGRPQRGEAPIIVTLIGCASAMCLLGVVYLAAYAKVARDERAIHSLQQNVSIAQARHQMLVQDLAHLQNAKRIDTLASQMKMVHVGASEYIGDEAPASAFAYNSAPAVASAQLAPAQ